MKKDLQGERYDHGGQQDLSHLQACPSFWVHGAGLSGSTWDDFTRDLPEALTPDLPGHGCAPAVRPARVSRYASELAGKMPETCVLIGHSLGGMVAMELAARHPERVRALVLIECVPTVRTGVLEMLAARIGKSLIQLLPPRWFGWVSALGQTGETGQHLKDQLSRHTRASIAAALEAAIDYDGRSALARITAPTLVLVGRKNRATHRGAQWIARAVPGARLASLPGGHMLHTDNPVQLRRAIDQFLGEVLGGAVQNSGLAARGSKTKDSPRPLAGHGAAGVTETTG